MANGAGRWQAYSRVGTGGWQFLGWTARDQPVLAGPDRDLQCRNETRSTAGGNSVQDSALGFLYTPSFA
jgi:hypothetical protein